MSKRPLQQVEIDTEADEQDVAEKLQANSTAAVVTGTDWTTETVVSQLQKGNIQLSPKFQRRDAWRRDRKSRFIESLIVGLPIPQIVLAESKDQRGRFIVLDGKQRLLSLLQFWGLGEGPNNSFSLSGLTLRDDLSRLTFHQISTLPKYASDLTALSNQTIRTVVIRNWRNTNLLHTIFLRLNTGSVNLSPQELRQALIPGPFSDHADQFACNSPGLRTLLGLNGGPDSRMRDIEILARFIAFRFFAPKYPGRMKAFLDNTFDTLNKDWQEYQTTVEQACSDFEDGVKQLIEILGDEVARKPDSPQFNRAIFDALIYYHSQQRIRIAISSKATAVKKAYKSLFTGSANFLRAIESDTAGSPNTLARFDAWGTQLATITGQKVLIPPIPVSPSAEPSKAKRPAKSKES